MQKQVRADVLKHDNELELVNLSMICIAEDTYKFLVEFFKMYPDFVGRDFYLAGESYAGRYMRSTWMKRGSFGTPSDPFYFLGHYIPNLAKLILQKNAEFPSDSPLHIHLKGMAIGNPWTNPVSGYQPVSSISSRGFSLSVYSKSVDLEGIIFYWWTHGLITREECDQVFESCQLSSEKPFKNRSSESADCDSTLSRLISRFGPINVSSASDVACLDGQNKHVHLLSPTNFVDYY